MTTTIDFANKWDLNHPKRWVVRKSSSSLLACFAQELQQFTKRSSRWFFVLTKSFLYCMHYCYSLVCARQEGRSSLWGMKCFFNVHEDNRVSFMLFGIGIDVCLEVFANEGNTFFLQTHCLYLLKSFCALCIELSRHFFASLQCVGQRSIASMVCVTSFKTPRCACVLQWNLLEIFHPSQSYRIPKASMKLLSKSTSNFHARC